LFFVLREPKDTQAGELIGATQPSGSWFEVLKSRNIIVSMLALFCAMSCVFVLSAMVPDYLIGYLGLTPVQMGFVTSALGFGGFFGQFGVPGISDMFGRKLVAIAGFIGAAVSVWIFARTGANPTMLFVWLFVVSFFSLGNVALLTGPIATEAAPIGLVASAIGIVVGAGEIFGGGVAPIIAGNIAENYGIQNVLFVALIGVAAGIVVCMFLKETAPGKVTPR
jgi:predicted MFS family arabinose efflux permease